MSIDEATIRGVDDAGGRRWTSAPARYLVFVRERFPPGAYLPLICVFVAAGYVPSAAWSGTPVQPLRFIVAALVVGAALLHLRMVDELKDAAVDRLGRPWRPLARGLVSEREMRVGAAGLLLISVALAATLGVTPLIAFLPAAGYMLLADVEFFARDRIHRYLGVYALVHSPVIPFLMAFAWWASPAAVPSATLAGLTILGWGVGMGLEVSRKTCAPEEERPFVETYSSAIGRRRAGWLAAASLAVAMIGGALYAWMAGAGSTVTLAAMVASGVVLGGGAFFGSASHRTNEAVGSIVGLAVLLWPIGVVVALGGAGR